MSEERGKGPRFGSEENRGGGASRARNRTVLLSPETIGQVRAGLADEEDAPLGAAPVPPALGAPVSDPLNELLPPLSGGWEPPVEEPKSAPVEPPPVFTSRSSEPAETRRPVTRFTPQPVNTGGWGSGLQQSPAAPANPGPVGRPGKASAGMVRPVATQPEPAPAPRAQAHAAAPVRQAPRSKIVGFLISYDTQEFGEVHEVRAGRWLVTSRPTDHQDYILIDDETVSPLHAIIRATAEGKVQVLDQLSEFGTGVTRAGTDSEEEVAGSMASVAHGDVIRFGKRNFVVCLVPSK